MFTAATAVVPTLLVNQLLVCGWCCHFFIKTTTTIIIKQLLRCVYFGPYFSPWLVQYGSSSSTLALCAFTRHDCEFWARCSMCGQISGELREHVDKERGRESRSINCRWIECGWRWYIRNYLSLLNLEHKHFKSSVNFHVTDYTPGSHKQGSLWLNVMQHCVVFSSQHKMCLSWPWTMR